MQEITKIVLTGGPCAGKTTAKEWIKDAFSQKGYTVLFVPETATELITGGVAAWTCGTPEEYQLCQMRLQLAKEEVYLTAAKTMPKEKILIVCDRGMMDNLAYMTEETFNAAAEELGLTKTELRDGYDAVFHLVTAANGACEEYLLNLESNPVRIENAETAIELDNRLISAWTGHPHLRVIDNSTGFEEKMKRLIDEIAAFLGGEKHYETERKFLIEYPDTERLKNEEHCSSVEITQTYLISEADEEVRVRRRGENGSYVYFKTVKKQLTGIRREESESRITEAEYQRLLEKADPNRRPIEKTRYCLTFSGKYFEIDIYPFWKDKAIMEIELKDESEKFEIPPFIRVIKEVTEDEQYKNSSLARL